jgi:hypothetical protein
MLLRGGQVRGSWHLGWLSKPLRRALALGIALAAAQPAHARDRITDKSWIGDWCFNEDSTNPQTFHRKRHNEKCDYGFKIRSTYVQLMGVRKCAIDTVNGEYVLGKNEGDTRYCFSADISYDKGILSMEKIQP